jgi:hypothetical protein
VITTQIDTGDEKEKTIGANSGTKWKSGGLPVDFCMVEEFKEVPQKPLPQLRIVRCLVLGSIICMQKLRTGQAQYHHP